MCKPRFVAVVTVIMIAIVSTPGQASAAVTFIGNDSHTSNFDHCVTKFESDGGDPGGAWQADQENTVETSVATWEGGYSSTRRGATNHPFIRWAADSTRKYSDGVAADPCSALYHELSHVEYGQKHGYQRDECWTLDNGELHGTGIEIGEVEATRSENEYRRAQGLPLRAQYGGRDLPAGTAECYRSPSEHPTNPGDPFPASISVTYHEEGPERVSTVSFSATKMGPCTATGLCQYLVQQNSGSGEMRVIKPCSGKGAMPPWHTTTGSMGFLANTVGSFTVYKFYYAFEGIADHFLVTCSSGSNETQPSSNSGTQGAAWAPGQATLRTAITSFPDGSGEATVSFD